MSNVDSSQISCILSTATVEELYLLWQKTAADDKRGYLLIEDQTIAESFALLISQKGDLSVLLQTTIEPPYPSNGHQLDPLYQVFITWNADEINNFIESKNLPTRAIQKGKLIKTIEQKLFLNLLTILNTNRQTDVCRPIQTALDQRVTQEKVLYQVISHIRQSLDLTEILDTTVQEVRDFLQVDRLLIFQFDPEHLPNDDSLGWGRVTYESKSSEAITPLLGLKPLDNCFSYVPEHQKKFHQGAIVTVDDVNKEYVFFPCLLEFLHSHSIYAKMVAPIVVRGKLWGLLIAHQCSQTRVWESSEKIFLGHIGEHLSVAIDQAQLYAEVQAQKKNFEQRVIERTQELKESLLASQSAYRSKNAFLDSVTHELRTPLTCVIGLSATLLHWSSSSSVMLPVEKQHQYLETIQKSGKQLLELINEILEFSQLEAGNSLLNVRQFSLIRSGNLVIKSLEQEAKNAQINLEFEIKSDLEQDLFWGDAERIEQIIYHLLSNAIKFTPKQGRVSLKIWKGQNEAVFQIEDTGIGIAKENLPRLFEKFEQLEKYRGRVYPGTGLGLALTKQLVELNHGRIEVKSTIGEGSTFTVWIPNNIDKQRKILAKKHTEPILGFNKTIILIEKDEETATLICELLTAAQYQIVWLIDSATALKKVELLQPKLVIVDKELSEHYHISRDLRYRKTTQNIKILLLSNQISYNEQNEIDDYLLKPIQPNLLLQRITSLLSYES
jgi:two-component system sensor histidine kinase/response regulator